MVTDWDATVELTVWSWELRRETTASCSFETACWCWSAKFDKLSRKIWTILQFCGQVVLQSKKAGSFPIKTKWIDLVRVQGINQQLIVQVSRKWNWWFGKTVVFSFNFSDTINRFFKFRLPLCQFPHWTSQRHEQFVVDCSEFRSFCSRSCISFKTAANWSFNFSNSFSLLRSSCWNWRSFCTWSCLSFVNSSLKPFPEDSNWRCFSLNNCWFWRCPTNSRSWSFTLSSWRFYVSFKSKY